MHTQAVGGFWRQKLVQPRHAAPSPGKGRFWLFGPTAKQKLERRAIVRFTIGTLVDPSGVYLKVSCLPGPLRTVPAAQAAHCRRAAETIDQASRLWASTRRSRLAPGVRGEAGFLSFWASCQRLKTPALSSRGRGLAWHACREAGWQQRRRSSAFA